MRYLIITFLFFFSLTSANAQVSIGNREWNNYNIRIDLVTENDSVFLMVIYSDAKNRIVDTPKLLLRLMDDSVISLDGKLLGTNNKTDGGYVVFNVAVADNYYVSEAKFPIAKEQIKQFEKGIKKLRLDASPKFREKEWKRDKIGMKLYKKYLESSSNSFEDDF